LSDDLNGLRLRSCRKLDGDFGLTARSPERFVVAETQVQEMDNARSVFEPIVCPGVYISQ
jgi:hypothetical protein